MTDIIKNDISEIVNTEGIDWNRLFGKTILITGANGMLPSYLVFVLLELNCRFKADIKILALGRNADRLSQRFNEYNDSGNLHLIVQDVSLPFQYDGDVDFIIHAASQASPQYYSTDPVGTIKSNIFGTFNLLEFARTHNTESFLFFSSGAVVGQVDNEDRAIDENTLGSVNFTLPKNCYAESKRMGENLVAAFAHQFGLNAKSVRISHTYGPTLSLSDNRSFSDFCRNILNNEDIVLHSDGSARRPFCYISDATTAFFLILLEGESGQSYNMANPDGELSIKELAELLLSLYPEKNLKLRIEIPDAFDATYSLSKSDKHRALINIGKLNNLGWRPVIPPAIGFKRTLESLLQSNEKNPDYA